MRGRGGSTVNKLKRIFDSFHFNQVKGEYGIYSTSQKFIIWDSLKYLSVWIFKWLTIKPVPKWVIEDTESFWGGNFPFHIIIAYLVTSEMLWVTQRGFLCAGGWEVAQALSRVLSTRNRAKVVDEKTITTTKHFSSWDQTLRPII